MDKLWVAKTDSSGSVTWHSAPDGEKTQCGIWVPVKWQAVDSKPSNEGNNRICKNCVHAQ